MRERDEQNGIRKYNYTLIRIKFPDNWILQGDLIISLLLKVFLYH